MATRLKYWSGMGITAECTATVDYDAMCLESVN
jgi:hypothetical protein